eukprot:3061079-Lingulodinium_polyedra.AAC.1
MLIAKFLGMRMEPVRRAGRVVLFPAERGARVAAAKRAFSELGQFWGSPGLPMSLRRRTFSSE